MPKKLQNIKSKDKWIDQKHTPKLRKHAPINNVKSDDDVDDDIILRIVLPGYNWFEEQVKNKMYTSDGQKRLSSTGTLPNPKLKKTEDITFNAEPLLIESTDTDAILKQKSLLSKRVINSTLMLLPNNSLPLKKRKIKEDMKETEKEITETSLPYKQENKKLCNPPIQKVTPILNKSNSFSGTKVHDATKHNETQVVPHPSAFKNEHFRKKSPYPVNVPNTIGGYLVPANNTHEHLNSIDPLLPYSSILRKTQFSVPDPRLRYQPQNHLPGSNCCYQCSLYRYQSPHLYKMPNQDVVNPVSNYHQNRKGYMSSNNPHNRAIASNDTLALPEIRQTFNYSHCSSNNAFENYPQYPPIQSLYNQSNPSSISQFNMSSSGYYPDNAYWAKLQSATIATSSLYKSMRMDSMCNNNYNSSNLPDALNVYPMMSNHQFPQQYHGEYPYHIG